MTPEQQVERSFRDSIAVKQAALSALVPAVAAAAAQAIRCLAAGGKILCCGNGGSAGDAQHFASELVNRYERERPGLPAIALTTDPFVLTSIANDYAYEQVFARQVHALGHGGDLLLAITTSGHSANVIAAVGAAQALGMTTLALTGRDGGKLAARLGPGDIELRVPAQSTARIQEVHLLIIHSLCELIDAAFAPRE